MTDDEVIGEAARDGFELARHVRMLGHASVAFTPAPYQHADDEMVDLERQRPETVVMLGGGDGNRTRVQGFADRWGA
jgi:hypothetical protein